MNEQQLAAVKLALGALKKGTGWMEHGEIITALQSIISQDAMHRMAEESRTSGLRLDDWDKIGCVNHDCDKCKAQPAPVQQKPLFADIIAQHPGLAEELKAQSEGFDLGFKAGLAVAQPAKDNTYGYAKSLAESLFKKHYAHEEPYASGSVVWEVSDTTIGVLTQIDNMVCTLVHQAAQPAVPEELKLVREWAEKWAAISYEDSWKYAAREVLTMLATTPVQPAPVKTYSGGKPWPVAPKPWVGLTDEEIDLFINGRGDEDDDNYVEPTGDGFGLTDADLKTLVRRAEAKLREKNGGAA